MRDTAISLIDLEPLLASSEQGLRHVAHRICDVYWNVGFGYLVNHDISGELIRGVFAASAEFHALPRAEKMRIEINAFHRGFIPINTSTDTTTKLAKVTKPSRASRSC